MAPQPLTCDICSEIWRLRYYIVVVRVVVNSWWSKRCMTVVGHARGVVEFNDCCRIVQKLSVDESLSGWTCINLTISRACDNWIHRKDWKVCINDRACYDGTVGFRLSIRTIRTRTCNQVNYSKCNAIRKRLFSAVCSLLEVLCKLSHGCKSRGGYRYNRPEHTPGRIIPGVKEA